MELARGVRYAAPPDGGADAEDRPSRVCAGSALVGKLRYGGPARLCKAGPEDARGRL